MPDTKKTTSIKIGSFSINFAQIENPEKLFEELFQKSNDHPDVIDERIPYWAELWPSAIGLSEFMTENEHLLNGKSVIELGCGLGLPGIIASMLGGKVILTDYLQKALDFAAYNWKLNFDSDAEIRLLDWRNPENFSRADVILASDIAYESRAFEPIVKTFKHLLKKDGIILLSEPNRNFAQEFINTLNKSDFKLSEVTKKVVKDGITYKISVYVIKN